MHVGPSVAATDRTLMHIGPFTNLVKHDKKLCLRRMYSSENLPDIFRVPVEEVVERSAGGHRASTDEVL